MGKFKLSLKLDGLGHLHYIEEDENVLMKNLGSLINLRDTIVSKLGDKGTGSIVSVASEYPNIATPSSQFDAILKVIYTDWAKRAPRIADEIHSALAMNAIHIEKKTLLSRLTTLTRQNKIRRVRKGKIYAYTVPLGTKK
jgi:hypothetical protein